MKHVQIPMDIFQCLYSYFVLDETTDSDVRQIRQFLTDKKEKLRAHMLYDAAFRQKGLPQDVRQTALDEYNDIAGRSQSFRYPIDYDDGPPKG